MCRQTCHEFRIHRPLCFSPADGEIGYHCGCSRRINRRKGFTNYPHDVCTCQDASMATGAAQFGLDDPAAPGRTICTMTARHQPVLATRATTKVAPTGQDEGRMTLDISVII